MNRFHTEERDALGLVPNNQRTTTLQDGTVVKKFNADDPGQFKNNLGLVKLFQATGDPFSRSEMPQMRSWVEGLNPSASTGCQKTLLFIQEAQRTTQVMNEKDFFASRRAEGHKIGLQFDMWTKNGRCFINLNYTYLKKNNILTSVAQESFA